MAKDGHGFIQRPLLDAGCCRMLPDAAGCCRMQLEYICVGASILSPIDYWHKANNLTLVSCWWRTSCSTLWNISRSPGWRRKKRRKRRRKRKGRRGRRRSNLSVGFTLEICSFHSWFWHCGNRFGRFHRSISIRISLLHFHWLGVAGESHKRIPEESSTWSIIDS